MKDLRSELAVKWKTCGIDFGDMILIHSNISRTLKEARRHGHELTPDTIVNSFLEAVGPTGTVLFPLFNFDFCSGKPFDIRSTPSKMGALTEFARLRPNAVRTGHPVYSFAVIGCQANRFKSMDNYSAYSEDSPFGVLKREGGKIAVLDLEDQASMTFYHHVEEIKGVPYRYYKDFTASYTDESGTTSDRTYQLYVRNIAHGVLTDVNAAGELMWNQGLYKGDRPNTGTGLRTVRALEMFEFVASIIDSGRAKGLLYSIEGEKK
jgi:aminoglycoside 3-N-acetyltransferase